MRPGADVQQLKVLEQKVAELRTINSAAEVVHPDVRLADSSVANLLLLEAI